MTMGADASIYSMIRPPAAQPGPLDQYGVMLQLKNMIDTGQLNDLHRQKLSGDLQEEEAFKSKIADWVKTGGQGNLPTDAYAASPTRAAAFDKSRMDASKSQAELAEKKMATLAKGASLMKERMATVKDEPSYQGFLQYTTQVMGPDDFKKMNLPPAYDPEFIKRSLVKADEMFTPKPQEVNQGGKIVVVDMNPFTNPKVVGMQFDKTATPEGLETARHNKATEAQAAATAARDRRQIVTDTEGNITVVDKDTLVGRPATDADGNVLKGRQNMTESQGKAAGMAMRAREAQTILNDLEAKGVTTRGLVKQGVEGVPLIGEGLAMGVNKLPGALGGPSGQQQQVEQARRNFVNAVLRVESGASINEGEFRNAEKQYFPMPGDAPEVIAQKKANRETAIRALEMQAGPQKSKNPMAPGGGSVMAGKGGIKFLGFEKP